MSEATVTPVAKPKKANLFQPGNPYGKLGGRPKLDAQFRALAKAEGLASLRKIADIRDNPRTPPAVQLAAARTLCEYGFGKPREMAELKEDNDNGSLQAPDIDALLG